MKVLTIKEPFAALIANKVKKIETRSWKTKYRGEIYIHAGVAKIDKKVSTRPDLKELYENLDLKYGYIICKARLVDCVYMDEVFMSEIKKNKTEYICGHYEIGRYAWILDDVEIIEPIKAKGQLGIWNYNK